MEQPDVFYENTGNSPKAFTLIYEVRVFSFQSLLPVGVHFCY